MTSAKVGGKFSRTVAGLALALLLCPIGGRGIAAAEKAVQAEKNPLGDIPDNQVFVSYNSPLGFVLQVPEGWSRSDRQDGARFFDRYNIIDVDLAPSAMAPNAGSVREHEAVALVAGGHAIKIASVEDVRLKGGPAVRIVYTSTSDPNPVTGKQIRLEHERFIFFKDGRAGTVDFAAPQGADNADQWRLMVNSFRQ